MVNKKIEKQYLKVLTKFKLRQLDFALICNLLFFDDIRGWKTRAEINEKDNNLNFNFITFGEKSIKSIDTYAKRLETKLKIAETRKIANPKKRGVDKEYKAPIKQYRLNKDRRTVKLLFGLFHTLDSIDPLTKKDIYFYEFLEHSNYHFVVPHHLIPLLKRSHEDSIKFLTNVKEAFENRINQETKRYHKRLELLNSNDEQFRNAKLKSEDISYRIPQIAEMILEIPGSRVELKELKRQRLRKKYNIGGLSKQ